MYYTFIHITYIYIYALCLVLTYYIFLINGKYYFYNSIMNECLMIFFFFGTYQVEK